MLDTLQPGNLLISNFNELEFEPVGKWFEHYTFIRHQGDLGYGFMENQSDSESDDEAEADIVESPEYLKFLATLDPKNWKDQDHYKVLGLEKLRYKATPHQIKRAHKAKVLKHHPDKKKDSCSKERDYFTCITKAFEILSNPVTRCAFDSVDPEFDDSVPSISDSSKKNFYKVFGKAFDLNSRWSIKKNVPPLGDENSSFESVNKFYSFWYDFDSWRQYSYLDEESKESAQDRDERRWIDKQNKAERAKRKKEEVTRIRQLVDNAYACDPRIVKFKQDEKKRKEDEKNRKREAARLLKDEENKKLEEARLLKEKQEEEERLKAEAEKKEKEQIKKQTKKERKTIRTKCKELNYFASNDDEKLTLMDKIEQLIESLNLEEASSINKAIEPISDQTDKLKELILSKVEEKDNQKLKQQMEMQQASRNAAAASQNASATVSKSAEWCDDEVKLLVKGAQLIPIGTRNRWEVIANFIEEHSRGKYKRTEKEVLSKSKEMQKMSTKEKELVNKNAYEKAIKNVKETVHVSEKPSERYITPGEQLLAEQGSNPATWSAEEQKIFEQALKTYGSNMPDRWDRISECLPTRSKKDCIIRYKELVELIQAKKKAQTKLQK